FFSSIALFHLVENQRPSLFPKGRISRMCASVPSELTPSPLLHRHARYPQEMVRFTVLASGSKGNSTVVSGGRTRILVDAGLSCRELFRRMRLAGEAPETLDAILITHEHSDHVGGLAVT